MHITRLHKILVLVIALATPWQYLYAENIGWKDSLNVLPPYCKDRAKSGSAGQKAPARYAALGGVWIHMHHYCAGIYAEYMANSTPENREKNIWLTDVITQMQYVGNHCSTRCVLYPELHTRWGWALGEIDQVGEAVKHYQLPIKSKPRYALAYARLSDLYLKLNQHDEARKILEQGRKVNPKSKMLQRKLNDL